jgi:hypothetical protein
MLSQCFNCLLPDFKNHLYAVYLWHKTTPKIQYLLYTETRFCSHVIVLSIMLCIIYVLKEYYMLKVIKCTKEIYCRALSVATIYKTGIGLTTGFIGSHTVTVYTLLQLATVHYNTCRVSSLCLHWLPVFQYLTRLALQD